jgi:Flp pilus assembly pilin Flp
VVIGRKVLRAAHIRLGQSGQGLVEYALIVLLVAVAIVGTVTTLGAAIATAITTAASAIP